MNPLIRRLASPAVAAAKGAMAMRTLLGATGQARSMWTGRSTGADGTPVPWLTYPAIEFFEAIDLSGASVFEFGSGSSTLYWAGRGAAVVSVEHQPAWFDEVGRLVEAAFDPADSARIERLLERDPERYAALFAEHSAGADLVIIDGIRRFQCAQAVAAHARTDAIVVLDNADWHERSDAVLRSSGRIRVPLTGFGAINPFVWTTAVYLPLGGSPLMERLNDQRLRVPPGGVVMDENRREREHER